MHHDKRAASSGQQAMHDGAARDSNLDASRPLDWGGAVCRTVRVGIAGDEIHRLRWGLRGSLESQLPRYHTVMHSLGD